MPPLPPAGLSLPPAYTLHTGYPRSTSYRHLRAASGLTHVTEAQAVASLDGSWFGCYITYSRPNPNPEPEPESEPAEETTVVAMGRIIGDGGWYFHIADMAVLPEHQRRGLGDVVLKTLLGRIGGEDVPAGKKFVSLLADEPGRRLYAKNGFVDAAPKELGMVLLMGD
ncbi:hypothetical protein PHISP_08279 [Aspergillus sp. HF37]|nr:hypothetical protein PHISP_08279 [Aspergillus sp. HF37]